MSLKIVKFLEFVTGAADAWEPEHHAELYPPFLLKFIFRVRVVVNVFQFIYQLPIIRHVFGRILSISATVFTASLCTQICFVAR